VSGLGQASSDSKYKYPAALSDFAPSFETPRRGSRGSDFTNGSSLLRSLRSLAAMRCCDAALIGCSDWSVAKAWL
jgi:hypothetical protein